MSMVFVDSFGHYTNAFLPDKWDVVSVPISPSVAIAQGPTSGRFGAGGVVFTAPQSATFAGPPTNDGQYIQKNYNGVSVIYVGLAVLQTSTQITIGGRLLTLLDSGTTQVGIDIMPSGQLRAVRSTLAGTGIFLTTIGSTGSKPTYTELGTSVSAIASSAYDFLEFKVTHHPTAGEIEVRRNGAAFWTLSNVNTAISGTNQSASMLTGGYAANLSDTGSTTIQSHLLRANISDVYLLNTVVDGSDANNPIDFIGDRHWEVLLPTADGFYTAWTPTGSADHFANIDEIPPSTADYNSTTTVNARDTFIVQDSVGVTTASVIVCLTMYVEKTTGGANEIKGLARLAGTDRLGTAFQVPSPVAFRQSFSCTDPAGSQWTVANYNSSEQGLQKTV